MNAQSWIAVILAMTAPISIVTIAIQRGILKKGLGISAIRFAAVCVIVPVVAALGVTNTLSDGAVGSIIGTVVGFLFSAASNKVERADG